MFSVFACKHLACLSGLFCSIVCTFLSPHTKTNVLLHREKTKKFPNLANTTILTLKVTQIQLESSTSFVCLVLSSTGPFSAIQVMATELKQTHCSVTAKFPTSCDNTRTILCRTSRPRDCKIGISPTNIDIMRHIGITQFWFSYTLQTKTSPGSPYTLMELQRDQRNSISITVKLTDKQSAESHFNNYFTQPVAASALHRKYDLNLFGLNTHQILLLTIEMKRNTSLQVGSCFNGLKQQWYTLVQCNISSSVVHPPTDIFLLFPEHC